MTGLKLVYGGSIPSFLVNLFVLVRMLVLQMCGKAEDIRVIILRLWRLIRRTLLLV